MMWIDGEYFIDPVQEIKTKKAMDLMSCIAEMTLAMQSDFPYNLLTVAMLTNKALAISHQPIFPPMGGIVPINKTGDLVIPNVNIR